MENPEIKLSAKDVAIRTAKGMLAAVPLAGGLLGELLDMVVFPQQQKKLNEWFEFVEKTLEELVEKAGKSKEEIFADETFLSVFQKTSRIYTSNVEEYKKPILQSYLKASVHKQIPLDKKYIFLKIIDELTEAQLMIFKDVFDNEHSENYLYESQLKEMLVDKYANGDPQYLELLIKGLQDFHLLGFSSADVIFNDSNQWHMRTSSIGKEFFSYLLE